jgi:iron complex outermembrane receptor protein
MYWKYTHGWKSGHFNTNAVPGVNNPFEPADPESIEAFEWGLKTAGFDSRIRANASLFYYLYKDYQVFVFEDAPSQGGAQLVVINAKSAEMLGAEFDLEIRPLQDLVPSSIEEFVFQLRGSWIRSEFLEFPHIFYVNNKPTLDDYSGNQLPNAPEFQFSGTLRWTFDLGRFGRITPRYDFTWQDDVFFDQTAGRGLRNGRNPETPNPEFTTGQAAYMLQNVRLSWTAPGGQFEVSGWCRNIMDERYKTYAFDVSNVRGVIINFVSDPRTCGGELNFTW